MLLVVAVVLQETHNLVPEQHLKVVMAALAEAEELEVARTYGVQGGAVHDPRTGASRAKAKDVFRGNLEPFLRAREERGA